MQFLQFRQLASQVADKQKLTAEHVEEWDQRLHAAVVQLKYSVVRSSRAWYLVRLYHRVFMFSFSCEAIAEHVGSIMRLVKNMRLDVH